MIHGFKERKAESMDPVWDARIETILRGYFGFPADYSLSWKPRETPFGHDGEVVAFGVRYTFDDKRRLKKDYGDELLELVSNTTTGTPGWTRKAGRFDYILHVYGGRWTIWPGPALEAAFEANSNSWARSYGTRIAPNAGYTTVNVPVPTKVLRAALAEHDAPICPHCGWNVGRFRSTCGGCLIVSCCAIGDWLCPRCAGEVG